MTATDHAPSAASVDRGRKVALRALCVGMGLVLSSVGVVALLLSHARVYSEDNRVEKVEKILEYEPKMLEHSGPVGLVFGSSLANAAFSPVLFESQWSSRTGTPITTYNLGLAGLNTHYHYLIERRILNDFQQAGRPVALSVLEFAPFQATATAARSIAPLDEILSVLDDPRTLFHTAIKEPVIGARRLAFRYIFGGANPGNLGPFLTQWMKRVPGWWPRPAPPLNPFETLYRRVRSKDPEFVFGPTSRGGPPRFLFPDTREDYDRAMKFLQKPEVLAKTMKGLIEHNDVLDLRFSEELVSDFVKMCQLSKKIAERTVLVLAPTRDSIVQKRSPEAKERLRVVLGRIERECGMPFIDVGEQFEDEDYMDGVHLNESTGAPKYTRLLVEGMN